MICRSKKLQTTSTTPWWSSSVPQTVRCQGQEFESPHRDIFYDITTWRALQRGYLLFDAHREKNNDRTQPANKFQGIHWSPCSVTPAPRELQLLIAWKHPGNEWDVKNRIVHFQNLYPLKSSLHPKKNASI